VNKFLDVIVFHCPYRLQSNNDIIVFKGSLL